jgi:hypothetical protein
MHELGVGRKRHRLRLHGCVDDNLEKSEGLAAFVRVATFRLSWSSATSLSSPICWRQRVSDDRSNGSLWTKNSSPQKS